MKDKLATLKNKLTELTDISSAIGLLSWDQQTYMPPGAAEARGRQISTLSAIHHRFFTDPEIGNLLNELNEQKVSLSADEALLISETLYDYNRANCLPEKFVKDFAEAETASFEAWAKARPANDFKMFQPHLEKIVELTRQKADYYGYENSPYDAMLESYERGVTASYLEKTFEPIKTRQSQLVDQIVNSSSQPDLSWLNQNWDQKEQLDFTKVVIEKLGYDYNTGRQDLAAHPFSTGLDLYDCRITTRVDEQDLFSCLMASIHEAGHAMYEQGLPAEHYGTTLCHSISLGIHESQSRMWENQIGRSLPFWKYFQPKMAELFNGQLANVSPEQMYAGANRVQRSFIRVEADECTYNLHVILRFEIERKLIEGDLEVADLPDAWNSLFKEMFTLDVPDDANGCMQDVHWSCGLIGYFPTYSLGNLYAAQMMQKIENDIPDLYTQIENGEFNSLLTWLRKNVHSVGRKRLARELVKDITGEEPGSEPYLDYLEKKYKPLYGI